MFLSHMSHWDSGARLLKMLRPNHSSCTWRYFISALIRLDEIDNCNSTKKNWRLNTKRQFPAAVTVFICHLLSPSPPTFSLGMNVVCVDGSYFMRGNVACTSNRLAQQVCWMCVCVCVVLYYIIRIWRKRHCNTEHVWMFTKLLWTTLSDTVQTICPDNSIALKQRIASWLISNDILLDEKLCNLYKLINCSTMTDIVEMSGVVRDIHALYSLLWLFRFAFRLTSRWRTDFHIISVNKHTACPATLFIGDGIALFGCIFSLQCEQQITFRVQCFVQYNLDNVCEWQQMWMHPDRWQWQRMHEIHNILGYKMVQINQRREYIDSHVIRLNLAVVPNSHLFKSEYWNLFR